jgi:3-(3-hydroxy-phenyl)propionate hydroxylase
MIWDVAIVGYGPTGAVLANFLGQAGLAVAVLEREPSVLDLPRAAHFDGEVMRIFQALGLKADAEAVSRPGTKGMYFVSATGQTLLIRKGSEEPGPHACAGNYYFHQPELEAVLRRGVARFANVRVLARHEVEAVEDGAERARLRVRDLESGRHREISARYVVGCDGARSLVRRAIGSARADLGLHQPWLVLDLLLKREVELPEYTVQHCDPARPMTQVNMVGRRRRWEIMLMPGDDPATIAAPANVWRFLARWLTPADAEIERSAVYTFHSVIARGWRRGRLLIAGDAAHQTPPFLGQGMCAGIRDAANLAWKLGLVCAGTGGEALLDTYESEREPHVREFIELAVRIGGIIQATDPRIAAERDRSFAERGTEIFSFPQPALGPGLRDDAPPPVGQVFHQPRLDDGRLLDDATGIRFAVLGDSGTIAAATPATRACWERLGAAVLSDASREISVWLADHGARALVLRPDRYLFGLARDAAELDRLSARLPAPEPVRV